MGGLKDLVNEGKSESTSHQHRHYPHHEMEDKLWDWFDEIENEFPGDIKCDFIEVSTQMTKHRAKAYLKPDGTQYIRFAEETVDKLSDWEIRRILVHEMVHLYCYQNGHKEIGDGSHLFKWLCGAVGAGINQVNKHESAWVDLAEPFIDDDGGVERLID